MKTRKELDRLLAEYEGHIGTGSMQKAGRILPLIIRKLVALLDERVPTSDAPETKSPVSVLDAAYNPLSIVEDYFISTDGVRKTYSVDVGDLPPERATEFLNDAFKSANPPPCTPCDVSIPNNPDLIPEFKEFTISERTALAPSARTLDHVGPPAKKLARKGTPTRTKVTTDAPAPRTSKKPKTDS